MHKIHPARGYEPKRCWVNERQKICYADRDEAERSARLVEFEHGLAPGALDVYKCEYGEHWHLANKNPPGRGFFVYFLVFGFVLGFLVAALVGFVALACGRLISASLSIVILTRIWLRMPLITSGLSSCLVAFSSFR